jgi:centrosomal protein CEP76
MEYRRDELQLTTHWDSELSYVLGPALAAYEIERAVGIKYGDEEFSDAIRRWALCNMHRHH